jgi:hypothetical protein
MATKGGNSEGNGTITQVPKTARRGGKAKKRASKGGKAKRQLAGGSPIIITGGSLTVSSALGFDGGDGKKHKILKIVHPGGKKGKRATVTVNDGDDTLLEPTLIDPLSDLTITIDYELMDA